MVARNNYFNAASKRHTQNMWVIHFWFPDDLEDVEELTVSNHDPWRKISLVQDMHRSAESFESLSPK
jgi:hypothetical protein